MVALLVLLTGLWIKSDRVQRVPQIETCGVGAWLAQHPADSGLRLLPADSLDDTLHSRGPKGPLTPPPNQTLQGIAAEIVLATIIDTSGNVMSTTPLRTRISRWQAGVSPDEIRRWTPQFDTAAVRLVRNQQYPSPTSKGNRVNALLCVTVRYEPIPAGKRFNVKVSARP
jgi:hypothetical protein